MRRHEHRFSDDYFGTVSSSRRQSGGWDPHSRRVKSPHHLPSLTRVPSFATAFAAAGNRSHYHQIEAVDSDGHMRSCPSDLRGVAGGRRTRSSIRLAGSRRIRVGSWNETKWKGSIVREGNGYKLWYSGSSMARNDVGIILIGRFKDNVVRVTRRSDRIMAISVIIEGETVNVISTYAPQVGLSDRIRRGFGTLWMIWEAVETFRATVFDKLAMEDMSASNADRMWNTLARVMKDVAKDSLGMANETAGTHSTHMESWWFCEEVQTKVATKQSRFKELLSCCEDNQEDIDRAKERYNAAKREARIAVDKAKDKAYEDLYKKLDSKDGMGRNKAVGLDQIPIEAWRCLEDKGVKWLTCLFNKIFSSAKMPNEWRMTLGESYRGKVKKGDEGVREPIWFYAEKRKALEDNGLRVSREKTEYLRCDFGRFEVVHQEMDIRIGDQILQPKESFRYLGSMLHRSGRIDDDVAHRIRVECWPIMKALSNKVEVAKLRMLRWTYGKTMVDMIPNGFFRAKLDVDSIIDKMMEKRLRWFRHVKRRPQTASVRRVEALVFKGSRRRGRPKLRWEDRLKMDMNELYLSEEMTSDRNAWRDRIKISG
nr:hypothetical protein [Tanacetum cinerariifolium]